jgi:ABC-type phosphate/phosphonate transport system substrate-binding protein
MIKRLIVILFLGQLGSVIACDSDIVIGYTPFVSSLTINKFFDSFHKKLALEIDCPVRYVRSKNFDEVLSGLSTYKYDAMLLPGAYHSAAMKLGYDLIATVERNDSIFIVANKKFKGRDLVDFAGLDILILDHFSESGAQFEQAMADVNMLSKVNIHEGSSYERMVLSVINDEFDIAVILPEYWDILSSEVKGRHLRVVKKIPSFQPGMVTPPKSEEFNKVLYQVLIQDTRLTWGEPKMRVQNLPILDAFIKEKMLDLLEL